MNETLAPLPDFAGVPLAGIKALGLLVSLYSLAHLDLNSLSCSSSQILSSLGFTWLLQTCPKATPGLSRLRAFGHRHTER